MVTMTDAEVLELAESAIQAAQEDKEVDGEGWTHCDALCVPIFERLGIETGDVAAHFWSGREEHWNDLGMVASYIRFEINWDYIGDA